MLQELLTKQIDIYIALVMGLVTGIPCTFLGLLLDRWLKGRPPALLQSQPVAHPVGLTITRAIDISVKWSKQSGPASTAGLTEFAIPLACIAYLFFRQEVLLGAMLLTFALVGLWVGAALHSLWRGDLRGLAWPLYLLAMLVFAVAVMTVIVEAMHPSAAPAFFGQWQQYVKAVGLNGLFKSGAIQLHDVPWLLAHVLGVALTFLMIRDAALSIVFYAAVSRRELSESIATRSWLLRWAARHSHPRRQLVALVIFPVVAYGLVSGVAVVWATTEFPSLVRVLMQYVLYGDRGMPR